MFNSSVVLLVSLVGVVISAKFFESVNQKRSQDKSNSFVYVLLILVSVIMLLTSVTFLGISLFEINEHRRG